jgi:shikimate kinase
MSASTARPPAAGPRAVLIGPPGAGKTTVGKALARRWGVEFRDSDVDVEAAVGMPVADVFVSLGEPVFREHERVAVATALAEHDGVLALGGGAVMTPAVADLISGARVVFLDVSLADAGSRVGLNIARPLLLGNVRGQLKALMEARHPTYERVSRAVVDTSGRTVEEVVLAVEDALAALDAPDA